MEPLLFAEFALIGAVAGFLAGLLGIGGGMIMVPFIAAILTNNGVSPDLAVKMGIATSMATIVFTSTSSVLAQHRRGALRWDIVRSLSPGIVLGAALASLGVFALLKGRGLAILFSVFVLFSATQMLIGKKPAPSRTLPGPLGQLCAGGVIGFLSGLVGAGGAFVSVPYMIWCNVATHHAVATSAALGFPIAFANVAGYIVTGWNVQDLPPGAFGYLYLPALLVIALASVSMAPLGVRAAHALPVEQLRRVFAGLLYLLAAYMLYQGLAA